MGGGYTEDEFSILHLIYVFMENAFIATTTDQIRKVCATYANFGPSACILLSARAGNGCL